MIKRFWLLGSADRLSMVRENLQESWGLKFQDRESDYLGGLYLRGDAEAVHEIVVLENVANGDGEIAEPEFAEYGVLIYATQHVHESMAAVRDVDGVDVLRVEEL